MYLAQLHGDETPRYCEKIADYISVIKAFRLRDDDDVLWKIKDYQDIVDMFLFDTAGAEYGGTGKRFNWDILLSLNINSYERTDSEQNEANEALRHAQCL